MRRTHDVSLWHWPSTLEVTAIVHHTRLGTLSEYQVQISVILRLFVFDLWAIGPTRLRLILRPWPLTLEIMAAQLNSKFICCGWCGSSFSIHISSVKFVGLVVRKIWCTMYVSINGPDDPDLWPFDIETMMRVASGGRPSFQIWAR